MLERLSQGWFNQGELDQEPTLGCYLLVQAIGPML
jgi:hypothetical protein